MCMCTEFTKAINARDFKYCKFRKYCDVFIITKNERVIITRI